MSNLNYDFDYDFNYIYDYDILKSLVKNVCLSDKMQKQIIDKYFSKYMDDKIEDIFYWMSSNPSLNKESQLILSKNKCLYIYSGLVKNPNLIPEIQMEMIDLILNTQTHRPLEQTEFLFSMINRTLCEEAQLKLYPVLNNDHVFIMMGNCDLCERLQKIFLKNKLNLYKLAQLPNLCEEVQYGLFELGNNIIYKALMSNPCLCSSLQDKMSVDIVQISTKEK